MIRRLTLFNKIYYIFLPVRSSITVHPKDQISQELDILPFISMSSGAIQ